MQLPTLFVPGAQKGASSTFSSLLRNRLNFYRGEHPEPHFFSRDCLYKQGLGFYRTRFYGKPRGRRYLYDDSQSYMPLPFVPERIREAVGKEAKFIFLLRNPVERMESAFKHFRVKPEREMSRNLRGIVPPHLDGLSLSGLLEYEKEEVKRGLQSGEIIGRDPMWDEHLFPYNYAYVGCYSVHIENYMQFFSIENMLFITFEEIIGNQKSVVKKVADFMEVKIKEPLPDEYVHANKTLVYRNERLGEVMRSVKNMTKGTISRKTIRRLRKWERKLLKKRIVYRFDNPTYNQILKIFDEEINRTAQLTGLELSHWKVKRCSRVA